jgi:Rps23 Pro-64 3,4-dihydroxylase Tpa1-like proline 4-hydroxylase
MPYIQYFDFLDKKTNRRLYKYTLSIEKKFDSANILDYAEEKEDTAYRKAKVVFDEDFEEFYKIIAAKILDKFSEVCELLRIREYPVDEVEVHLTAHNDGDYFKKHSDSGSKETNNRIITFVYYFNCVPKRFKHGELILLEKKKTVIDPRNNKIIFFNSSAEHEVKPIICPSRKFAHSRFTLNGWILKKKIKRPRRN